MRSSVNLRHRPSGPGRLVSRPATPLYLSDVQLQAGELFSFGDAFDGKLGNGASANVSDKPRFTFPGLLPSFTAVLEAAAYKQLRKQPLSLVPGVLTQGTKPPATKEEAERLRRHEAGRQQRVADQRAKLQEEKQQRMAHDKSDKQRKRCVCVGEHMFLLVCLGRQQSRDKGYLGTYTPLLCVLYGTTPVVL